MFKLLSISTLAFASISCSNGIKGETSSQNKDSANQQFNNSAIQQLDTVPSDSIANLNSLNNKVRDGKISKEDALAKLKLILPLIKTYYFAQGGKAFSKTDWIFPLKGYNSSNIGGKNGSGYVDDGYNYFDGNKHK